ncbi:hypothetical protein BJ742DRAFT_857333 [Cladochytrium replicatum]|nr:hypothetical protein BJ742DRAFT_857333 [Cladochytrium replicatum]
MNHNTIRIFLVLLSSLSIVVARSKNDTDRNLISGSRGIKLPYANDTTSKFQAPCGNLSKLNGFLYEVYTQVSNKIILTQPLVGNHIILVFDGSFNLKGQLGAVNVSEHSEAEPNRSVPNFIFRIEGSMFGIPVNSNGTIQHIYTPKRSSTPWYQCADFTVKSWGVSGLAVNRKSWIALVMVPFLVVGAVFL